MGNGNFVRYEVKKMLLYKTSLNTIKGKRKDYITLNIIYQNVSQKHEITFKYIMKKNVIFFQIHTLHYCGYYKTFLLFSYECYK